MNAQLSSVPVGLGSTLFFRCRWWAPSVWHVWFAFIFACVSGGSLCGVRNHGLFVLFCAFLWDTALFLLVFCVRCLVWHLINSHDFSFFFGSCLAALPHYHPPGTAHCPLTIPNSSWIGFHAGSADERIAYGRGHYVCGPARISATHAVGHVRWAHLLWPAKLNSTWI